MERLFNLDIQLLADATLLIIAVPFLFIILSYLLFNPVRKFMGERRTRIANNIHDALKDKEEAEQFKEEYEKKLKDIDKEAEKILADARSKALSNENKIISDAKEEAAAIIAKAREDARLEAKAVEDEMKQQMIAVAALMAQKVVTKNIDTTIQASLVDDTLKEMGGFSWQSR